MKKDCFFCLLVAFVGCFILFSHPFFKLPYDMWEMIMRIESIFYTGNDFTFFPLRGSSKYNLWPWCWAKIFMFFNISDPFTWGYIIHVTQTFILSISLFFFCYTAFSLLLPQKKDNSLLAFISMLLWFLGTGTFSVQYQQAWIMWYSVNYQCISMAILWLSLGLTLLLLYKDLNWKIKISIGALIVSLFVLGLFIHSMEMGYYLIFLTILLAFKIGEFILDLKKWKLKIILIVVAILLTTITILSVILLTTEIREWLYSFNKIYLPWKRHFSSINNISDLFKKIVDLSWPFRVGGNRIKTTAGELAFFSLCIGGLFTIGMWRKYIDCKINKNLFFALLSSAFLFFMIPIIPILDGVVALFSHPNVVYRFFYVSPWFIFTPLVVYILLKKYNVKKYFQLKLLASNFLFLLLSLIVSKFILFSALYGNVASILNSLDNNKVGCQYSKDDIARLKKIIEKKEKKATLKPLFYIRGDLGPIVATIPGKNVFAYSRVKLHCSKPLPYYRGFIKRYKNKAGDKNWKQYKRYHAYVDIVKKFNGYEIINIDLPNDFPRDESIFKYFTNIEKPSDKVVNIEKSDGVNKIYSTNILTQSIRNISRIARIQLLLENLNPKDDITLKNREDIILKIKESPDAEKCIAEVKINSSIINKKDWYTFKFPDYIYLNHKKTYYLVLESPESSEKNAIIIHTNNSTKYKYGVLFINGKKTQDDLCMKIWKGY